MHVFGIVFECNPFHAGHAKLIAAARNAGADYIIGVMSGNFVQRGEPAVLPKFFRAEELARQGVDLVVELPVRYALSSAERFAGGAVEILWRLGADTVYFGSECGDVMKLAQVAEACSDADVIAKIRKLCETGLSYPTAQSLVLGQKLGNDYSELLNSPNNILGVEYIKAIRRLGCRGMSAMTLKREPGGVTAHGVREAAAEGKIPDGAVSPETAAMLRYGGAVDDAVWSAVALLKLREADLDSVADSAGGLGDRIRKAARESVSIDQVFGLANTKRYTMSRVKRTVCRAVLGIDGAYPDRVPYARILAVGAGGTRLLGLLKNKVTIQVSDSLKRLSEAGGNSAKLAAEECRATDLYNLVRKEPVRAGEEYFRKLYLVDV